jgi:L-ascorbate metabolism protein UlaG (beta-lactamase superfamily)
VPLYQNFEPTQLNRFPRVLRWALSRRPPAWPAPFDAEPGPPPPPQVEGGGLRATFVNHATVLLQSDGLNLLCDPHWGERCSPVSFAGPRRVRPPGLRLQDLPRLHAILLSHNHYDHMDLGTLEALFQAHLHAPLLTGLGVARSLPKRWRARAVEMDWWQSHPLSGPALATYVPGRHFSARGLHDRFASRWGGFHISFKSGGVYFAGDTGYGSHFKAILARLGAPRLAVLPVGAYEPRWFMQHHHMNPADAVQARQDLGAERALAMHFGTFPLADEGYDAPMRDLAAAKAAAGLGDEQFKVLGFGEAWEVPGAMPPA